MFCLFLSKEFLLSFSYLLDGSWYAGGTIQHISAVDHSVIQLTWIDNSMPCGLQGLVFVSPVSLFSNALLQRFLKLSIYTRPPVLLLLEFD